MDNIKSLVEMGVITAQYLNNGAILCITDIGVDLIKKDNEFNRDH